MAPGLLIQEEEKVYPYGMGGWRRIQNSFLFTFFFFFAHFQYFKEPDVPGGMFTLAAKNSTRNLFDVTFTLQL